MNALAHLESSRGFVARFEQRFGRLRERARHVLYEARLEEEHHGPRAVLGSDVQRVGLAVIEHDEGARIDAIAALWSRPGRDPAGHALQRQRRRERGRVVVASESRTNDGAQSRHLLPWRVYPETVAGSEWGHPSTVADSASPHPETLVLRREFRLPSYSFGDIVPPMRSRRNSSLGRLLTMGASLACFAGCTLLAGIDSGTLVDGGVDAAPPDVARREDAPSAKDTGTARDARHDVTALPDADKTPEAGGAEAGTPEARAPETGPVDAADAHVGHDSGVHDAPTRDALATDAASGGVAVAGTSCTANGVFACGGHASTQVLQCDDGEWTASSTCPENDLCDSTTGQCAAEVAGCIGLSPADTYCSTDSTTVMQCGVDLVTATPVTTCGEHQACTASGDSATCTCVAPSYPSCNGLTATQGVCSSDHTEAITCTVDAQGCVYGSAVNDCGGGSCYVSAGLSYCCQNACATVEQYCINGATYQICSLDPTTGCNVLSPAMSCTGATPACLTGGACGCTVGAGECGGVARGANCVTNFNPPGGTICGCVTNGDCAGGGCCGSNNPNDGVDDNQCYANGSTLDGYTCSNNAWGT
jgi:hypothetical protein